MSGYRGRFAPSPTGRAHLGTARTALVAWLRARAEGGRYLMRIEDLDAPRVVPGATEAMLADLAWLGLDWDEGPDVGGPHAPYVQSARLELYSTALERLRARGLAYPCTCSRKEIASIASAPHGEDGPVYPGTCRSGPTHPERAPAWRFRMDEPPAWDDVLRGPSRGTPGDFVIQRADGVFAYQLAVVVDDAAMGITEVVRGDDLAASTSRQIALFSALGHAVPRFLHLPLVLGPDGERLGKRHGSTAISEYRAAGWAPERVVGLLAATLGLGAPGEAIDARSLIARFDAAALPRTPTIFDGPHPSAGAR